MQHPPRVLSHGTPTSPLPTSTASFTFFGAEHTDLRTELIQFLLERAQHFSLGRAELLQSLEAYSLDDTKHALDIQVLCKLRLWKLQCCDMRLLELLQEPESETYRPNRDIWRSWEE